MIHDYLQFVKQQFAANKPLAPIQYKKLIDVVESAQRLNDDLVSRMHNMGIDEREYLADLKYLREKNHAKGRELDASRATIARQSAEIEALDKLVEKSLGALFFVSGWVEMAAIAGGGPFPEKRFSEYMVEVQTARARLEEVRNANP